VLGRVAGLASLVGLAGCGGRLLESDDPSAGRQQTGSVVDATPDGAGTTTTTTTPTATATASGEAPTPAGSDLARQGVPATICETRPQPDPGIYAVVDPAFGPDWRDVAVPPRYRFEAGTIDTQSSTPTETVTPTDATLRSDATVIGVTTGAGPGDGRGGTAESGSRARAYPLSILWWHEVVNDDFGGPLLVTYCPICRSGMVADRLVDGAPAEFLVSGQLWQAPGVQQAAAMADGRAFGTSLGDPDAAARVSGNVVLVDGATGSYWSQVLARAICGPLAGSRLGIRASTVTTWGAWRREHPDTDVLLPPPASRLHDPAGRNRGR
jgi:hypothetical protein